MDPTPRLARRADARQLAKIYRQAFRRYERFRGGMNRLSRNTVVAERDGRVVGFGCWNVVRDPRSEREIQDLLACLDPQMRRILQPDDAALDLPITLHTDTRPALERGDWVFTALAVDPAYRGTGVGTALARHRMMLASRARAHRIYLHALTGSGSRSLYERLGFTPLVSKDHHYPDGTGMTLMVRDLRA